jgi:hypothetical protein
MLWLRNFCCRADRSPKDLLELSPEEQLRRQAADIEFVAALSALSILRWVALSKVKPAAMPSNQFRAVRAIVCNICHEPTCSNSQTGQPCGHIAHGIRDGGSTSHCIR